MLPYVARVSIVVALIATGGCLRPRPLGYPIEPGLSASFTPTQRATSEEYAGIFCSVLEAEFASSWDSCDKYVRMTSPYPAQPLYAIPPEWTVLRIGGFGAECVADTAEAFADAGDHLAKVHGLKQYHVLVGAFDTSEQNAGQIRDAILKLGGGHRFIVVAHSKGAADMMVALTRYPNELKDVRALITVAGAVGGSYLVDGLEKLNKDLLSQLDLKCLKGLRSPGPNAIDSMRRTNRQKFLADHEHLTVPAFSISAVSTEDNTSKILRGLWKRVAPYAQEHDSHIVEREAIVPGGQFLGRALGDHWAVAFPFDPNTKVKPAALKVIDKNKFPREALIEAAVRVALRHMK
jgi:pimeloyl-ACP methyl ester carboxylesterase